MPVTTGNKRPAGADVPEPASKRRNVEDPRAARCRIVSEALTQADSYPESVRSMLQHIIPAALGTVKEEQHRFQAAVANMVGEVLRSMESQAKATVAELQAKVDGCEADKSSRTAKLLAAEQALSALKDATLKQEACLQDESRLLATARKELHSVQKIQLAADRRLQDAEQKKEMLQGAQARLQMFIKDKAADKDELKDLDSLGDSFGLDRSLMQAVPLVLKKDPASRSGFDSVALEQFEAALANELAKQTTIIDEAVPEKAQRDAAAKAAQAACEEATARHNAVRETHLAAEKSEQEGEKELVAAREAVANFLPDAKALMDEYDDRKAWLDKLGQGPLAAFKELQDSL